MMAAGSATVPLARSASLARSRSQVSGSRADSVRSGSQSRSHYEETEAEAEADEFDHGAVQLPLPPSEAHTTARTLAGLGPPVGHNDQAPGLLHRLAMHGRTEQVAKLLQMREGEEFGYHSSVPLVDVNMYDMQGMAALHYAADGGHVDTCEVLLREHADPNLGKQNTGYTALHFASQQGQLATVKLLVNMKGDINAVAHIRSTGGKECGDRSTPLHCACLSKDLALISAMLEGISTSTGAVLTANVMSADGCGQTPLHKAAETCDDRVIKTLLNHKADIQAQNALGETALHSAVYTNNHTAVEVLLNRGADVKAESLNKETPIRLCAAEAALVNKAARRRRNTDEEKASLNYAQMIMEMLIERGAYLKRTDRLLEQGLPEHLKRRNDDNEQRAVNKAAGLGELTDEEVKRAQAVLELRRQKEEDERRKKERALLEEQLRQDKEKIKQL